MTMRTISRTGLALVLTSAGLMFSGAEAMAVSPCITTQLPAPPNLCAAGRNFNGYRMGAIGGVSLVDQIWNSHDVGHNPDNWELLKTAVDTTIPQTITAFFSSSTQYSDYVQCRAQGLLEGATCEMNYINPIPGCALDGFDWGVISASIYCLMAEQQHGLGDVVPWFVRPVGHLCADAFQSRCDDVYHYFAAGTPMSFPPPPPRTAPVPDPLCAQYAQGTPTDPLCSGSYSDVFCHSVFIDCAYDIGP